MSIVDILFVAMGLSMDNMAVAAASACGGQKHTAPKHIIKVCLAFCGVGIAFLTAGFFGGTKLQSFISGWDHWLAFFLLFYIGIKMVKESFTNKAEEQVCTKYDMTHLKTLLLLALATNIDVLAAGVSLAFYKVSLPEVLGILTVCIAASTIFGFTAGQKLGAYFGKRVEFLGGATLIVLSVKILITG